MADWKEFLSSEEFREYQRKLTRMMALRVRKSVSQIANGGKIDPGKLEGSIEMIHAVLKLPEHITKDEKLLKILKAQHEENIDNITGMLIKLRYNDVEESDN